MCACLLYALCACSFKSAPVPETPGPSPTPTEAPPEVVELDVPTPLVPEQVDAPTPPPENPATPEPLPPLSGIVIGIDPGHQQTPDYDTEQTAPGEEARSAKCPAGTRGVVSNVYEYEINLSVALKLKALLEAKGAKVILTRSENDVQLSNCRRADIMNRYAVDLAILLHCNGTDDASVCGAFMLVPTKARTAFFSENVRAANAIIEHYCAVTGLSVRKNKAISYSDGQTCFNWCSRPIVCIEMGHLSNEKEDLLLTNDAFQDKMAVGIFEGILACFRPEAGEGGGF